MGRSVPAVERALDILELFTSEDELSTAQIRQRLALPKTSVHELVNTLSGRSYLAPVDGHDHRYRLGVGALHLGSAYADRIDLVREGQAVARRVSADSGETVHVAVLDGSDVIYVAKFDSTQPVRMVSAVGRRLPAHCTAVGKPMLAALDTAELNRMFPVDADLAALTSHSITDARLLRKELADVRATGIALDNCESNDSVCCVAAPVHDHSAAVVAAISISVPVIRWNDQRRRELSDLVLDGAADLSKRLGFRTLT